MSEPWKAERPERSVIRLTCHDENQLALAERIKKAYETKSYGDLARITITLPKELRSTVFQGRSTSIERVDVIKDF